MQRRNLLFFLEDKKLTQMEKLECIQSLLKHKANPNITNKDNLTPLDIATEQDDVAIVRALLAAKAYPNHNSDEYDESLAFRVAINHGNLAIVKALLDAKANPDLSIEFDFSTHLIEAIKLKNTAIVRALLDAKANPDLSDANSYTPLMMAVKINNKELTEILIAHGKASLEQRNDDDKTVLEVAVENGFFAMIRLLLTHDAKISDPLKLFACLERGEPNDVLFSLNCLRARLRNHHDPLMRSYNEGMILPRVENYIKKLQEYNLLCRKKVSNTIDDATNKKIFSDVLSIICDYDIPTQRKEFESKNIDAMIQVLKEPDKVTLPEIAFLRGRARLFKPAKIEKPASKSQEAEERVMNPVVWHI
ncbi:MAG: ankyrin repeat domain-containing protein [Gammaproteobacteria bacterium]